ncbi:MAG: hypothetical protein IKG65_05675 [Exiguobacterium sp.]|nr:hypothetical protein [Exiguobacterium sp.]MBR2758702.1 hypothetical protein [Exiguobacterium sp.]MBR3061893.1 hypothetical protein [Exiguobacterium sp.]MBR3216971.1 hypothetical protein [Exiguobacterium sp.]
MNVIMVSLFGLIFTILPIAVLIIGMLWIRNVVIRSEKRADEQLFMERERSKQIQVLIERLDRIEQQLDSNTKRS